MTGTGCGLVPRSHDLRGDAFTKAAASSFQRVFERAFLGIDKLLQGVEDVFTQ